MNKHKKNKNEWLMPPLKKHVAMIQVSNDISLLQRKLSNILLQNAFEELTLLDKHSIPLRRLCDLAGFNSNNLEYLQEALRGLARTTMEWNIVQDDGKLKKSWGIASVLANCEIKDSICTYSYGGVLSEKLRNPEFFTRIDLSVQQRFNSAYALSLYENCLRYADIGLSAWFSVDLLKKLLGAHNQAKYVEFKKFTDRILKPAMAEVNSVSDIVIEPSYRRENRKIIAIQFKIIKNPQNALDLMPATDLLALNKQIIEELQQDFGFTAKQAQDACKVYPEDYIEEKIAYTRTYAQMAEIKNVRSFLTAALKENYQQSETFIERQKKSKRNKAGVAQQNVLEMGDRAAKDNTQEVEDYLRNLSASGRDALQNAFITTLSEKLRASYEKSGFKSRALKSQYYAFIRSQLRSAA